MHACMHAVHTPQGENTNYEVLDVYVLSDADRKAFLSAAAARHAATDGELAWLRLYFEEVNCIGCCPCLPVVFPC